MEGDVKLMKKIRIMGERIGMVEAVLLEDRNPETVEAIWENLPFELVQTLGATRYISRSQLR